MKIQISFFFLFFLLFFLFLVLLVLVLVLVVVVLLFFLNDTSVQCRPPPLNEPQLAMFFDLFFQFFILPLLVYDYAQFHHLFSDSLLSPLPWWLLLITLITLITFLFLSILLTRPIQFNWLILTNEGIYKSPKSWINSLLYRYLQLLFTLISPNILPKTFHPKAARR